jgi:type IV pilus assembly protein PilB
MKLGQILIKKGLISPQDLQQTVQIQPQTDRPLGELLRMKGLISDDELARALQEQQWRQKGYWVID